MLVKYTKLCLLILLIFTVSCAKDDNVVDEEIVIDEGNEADEGDEGDEEDNEEDEDDTEQNDLIKIHEDSRVASLLMTSEAYKKWKVDDEFENRDKLKTLTQKVYKKFEDHFDFIVFILNEDNIPIDDGVDYYGKYITISNNVEGIGLNTYNNSEQYGSKGKLRGVIQLTGRGFLQNGPGLHEIAHSWANYLVNTHGVTRSNGVVTAVPYIGHWGYTGGSSKGQLGGFDQSTLVENPDGSYTVGAFGQFANGGNSIPYNDFELYLMGLIPKEDVTPFDVFRDMTSSEIDQNFITFEAESRTTITPELISENRNPSYLNSQKAFKMLTIVLSDVPLTNDQWDVVNTQAERFELNGDNGTPSYNFWEATRGLATLEIGKLNDSVLE